MRKEHIEKKDQDRKTLLNDVDVSIPETFEELKKWTLSPNATEMEKYIFGRIYEDWKKGMCVSVQSKLDNRKKGLDDETKKIVSSIKNANDVIKNLAGKILRGETLTKEEMSMLTKKNS